MPTNVAGSSSHWRTRPSSTLEPSWPENVLNITRPSSATSIFTRRLRITCAEIETDKPPHPSSFANSGGQVADWSALDEWATLRRRQMARKRLMMKLGPPGKGPQHQRHPRALTSSGRLRLRHWARSRLAAGARTVGYRRRQPSTSSLPGSTTSNPRRQAVYQPAQRPGWTSTPALRPTKNHRGPPRRPHARGDQSLRLRRPRQP